MEEIALDPNALLVLNRRYVIKDASNNPIETPQELFLRVAHAIANAEENYNPDNRDKVAEEFYTMLSRLEFLPNSPTLMNAGRELGQLAACFVLPVDDSLDSIFESLKETAKIHQSGGGTGFSFSNLRPKDDKVASTMGVASGPVSFIKIFNMATEVIKQGGTRRGANMGILRIDHPDIEEFITIKRDPVELANFNLSVAITDSFMDTFERDGMFNLINPRTKQVVKTVRAQYLLKTMAESAWLCGEPGVLFIDTINKWNPTPHMGPIEATNPCGEMPLLPYESCCLGSINLSKIVENGTINWDKLKQLTHAGVRFLDNVIDINKYPVPAIEKITKENRKIGIGVMGFAHFLIKLGISYDSPDAESMADKVMSFIQKESKVASRRLAQERGVFPNYEGSIWKIRNLPQRNATTTTIAPTGTLSLIAGTSSGIEPLYDTVYTRILFGDIEVTIRDPLFDEMSAHTHAFQDIERLFRKAYQVAPEYHLKIQKRFQDHVDNAVSKTINLPENAQPEMILHIYREAYRMGLKGITVFRDKSRDYQILSCGAHHIC